MWCCGIVGTDLSYDRVCLGLREMLMVMMVVQVFDSKWALVVPRARGQLISDCLRSVFLRYEVVRMPTYITGATTSSCLEVPLRRDGASTPRPTWFTVHAQGPRLARGREPWCHSEPPLKWAGPHWPLSHWLVCKFAPWQQL